MKLPLSILLSILSLLALAYTGSAQTVREHADQGGAFVFKDIRVFDGESVLSNVIVVIQGRTIQAVGAEVPCAMSPPAIERQLSP